MADLKDNRIWHKQNFEKVRQEVREELDRIGAPGLRERLKYTMRRVVEAGEENHPDTQVKQYLYAMFGLVHHSRFGGLNEANRLQLMKFAEFILRTHQIPVEDTRLGFLYGDLYLIKSQIHRTEGKHVESLWEEQISNYLSQKASEERTEFQKLSIAITLLRMGHATLAWEELQTVDVNQIKEDTQWRWYHECHVALRLSYQLDKAKDFFQEHSKRVLELGSEHSEEWEWEGLCREAQVTGNIDELMRLSLPSKKFYKVPYLIEAFFIARIVKPKNWMERIQYLPKKKSSLGDDPHHWEAFWKTATVLKDAYENDTEYVNRLSAMGEVLSQVNLYRTVFEELLVRASLVRWLVRRPTLVFEKVAVADYKALCHRLSDGRSDDVLNLLPDVFASLEPHLKKTG